jgi:hypothetical protein
VNQQMNCSGARRSGKPILSVSARRPPFPRFLFLKWPETAVELVEQAATSGSQRLKAWLDIPLVQRSLIALILFNAVILGLETSSTVMAA